MVMRMNISLTYRSAQSHPHVWMAELQRHNLVDPIMERWFIFLFGWPEKLESEPPEVKTIFSRKG